MPRQRDPNQLELWFTSRPLIRDSAAGNLTFELGLADKGPSRSLGFGEKSQKLLDATFAASRPMSILVADDNEINRKIIRVILQKLGYQCEEAKNGLEALHQHRSKAYDYIFMDIDMPEMDGLEATQAIRESEGDDAIDKAEIVAVTANVSNETRLRCRRVGMNGYLEKPITAEAIKNQLLRSWARIRARKSREETEQTIELGL